MNRLWMNWLLTGALTASLAWNFRTNFAPATTEDSCCATLAGDCTAALAGLDLSEEQRRALEIWSRRACGSSEQAAADRTAREMCALLGAPTLDAARARELASEAGRLRGEALRACVDSIVEVRRILTPAQTAKLLEVCCNPSNGMECAAPAGGQKR